jgi:hypothetical protein
MGLVSLAERHPSKRLNRRLTTRKGSDWKRRWMEIGREHFKIGSDVPLAAIGILLANA